MSMNRKNIKKAKDDYVYWVMRKDVKVPLYRKVEIFTDDENEYWLKTFSHYQPIHKPQPPNK